MQQASAHLELPCGCFLFHLLEGASTLIAVAE